MSKYIFLILIGLAINNGCSETTLHNPLLGDWVWTGASGGIAGTRETPESTGNIIKLEISANSIKKYKNGDLVADNKYTIEKQNSMLYNEPRDMLIYDTGFRVLITLKGNDLTLTDDCNDCYTNTYKKE